ncbi:MAG: hypothetical protein LWW94_01360 [Candidatus Desulfofervidaceae bacterium]|nr:hypothetical protein [Candidatus Desulfofervidaceae bacterium]
MGSIKYASLHSTSRLIVVMGHESCGAVKKAHEKTGATGKALVEAAAKENVRMVIEQISKETEALREMQKRGELKIIGAYYYLESGKVEFWV